MSLLEKILGKEPVDLLIVGGKVVNPLSGEISNIEIAIAEGKFAGFGKREAKEVIDVKGDFVCPGFIDAHIHLESSMVHPVRMSSGLLKHGVTTVVADPHEIANVMGLSGIRYLEATTRDLPLSILFLAPSSVPSTPLECSGAILTALDLACLVPEPRFVGLAEVMDVPSTIAGQMNEKIKLFQDKFIDGHAPDVHGKELEAYRSTGPLADHECTKPEEVLEHLKIGINIMLRHGSASRDLVNLIQTVGVDNWPMFCFCTDDLHPNTLIKDGSIDNCVRLAVKSGLSIVRAVQLATVNAARIIGLKDRGNFSPGKRADLVTLDSETLEVTKTFACGQLITSEVASKLDKQEIPIPPHSVKLPSLKTDDFIIKSKGDLRCIGVSSGSLITSCNIIKELSPDILTIAVVERHGCSGRIALGLVQGFGRIKGAIGSTISHDSHNLVIVGSDAGLILRCANSLKNVGGLCVCDHDSLDVFALPIAGLMSNVTLADASIKMERLNDSASRIGCTLKDPFAMLSFLSLSVIPTLKITSSGLTLNQVIVPLEVS